MIASKPTKLFATLPSTAEVSSSMDVEMHWLTDKPVKLYQGIWISRAQIGILQLMDVRELIIIWKKPNNEVMNTIITI